MDPVGYVAIYAALVATVGAAWQIRQWTQDRPRMKIEAAFAYGGSPPPKEMISISIANIGLRAVTVHEAGLKFPDGQTIPYLGGPVAIGGVTLPMRIEGLDQMSVYFDQDALKDPMNQIGSYPNRCYVRIGGGKTFTSKIKREAIRSWFGVFDEP